MDLFLFLVIHVIARVLPMTELSSFCLWQIRPIDKKLQYQIQKLTRGTVGTTEVVGLSEKESVATQKTEDLLNYRPNPDMLVPRSDMTPGVSQDIDVSSSAIVFVFFF
jgi:hypothetical protein